MESITSDTEAAVRVVVMLIVAVLLLQLLLVAGWIAVKALAKGFGAERQRWARRPLVQR